MTVLVLATVFALVEVLDFATYNPGFELNPVVVTLGADWSFLLKVFLLLYVFAVTFLLVATGKYSRMVPVVLGLGIVAGVLGTLSNVVPR